MQTYHVTERVVVERHMSLHGTIRADFDPGRHEPQNEQEEILLADLAARGYAEPVDAEDTEDEPNQEDE